MGENIPSCFTSKTEYDEALIPGLRGGDAGSVWEGSVKATIQTLWGGDGETSRLGGSKGKEKVKKNDAGGNYKCACGTV